MVKKILLLTFILITPAVTAQGVPFDTLKLNLGNTKETVLNKLLTYGQVVDAQGSPVDQGTSSGAPVLAVENIMTAAGCVDLQFWFSDPDQKVLAGVTMSPSSDQKEQIQKFQTKYAENFAKKWGEAKTVQLGAKGTGRKISKTEWTLTDGRKLALYETQDGEKNRCMVAFGEEACIRRLDTSLSKAVN